MFRLGSKKEMPAFRERQENLTQMAKYSRLVSDVEAVHDEPGLRIRCRAKEIGQIVSQPECLDKCSKARSVEPPGVDPSKSSALVGLVKLIAVPHCLGHSAQSFS
jgi:hypothetical protein